MIVIQTQLSTEHFNAVSETIRSRFPAIIGHCQTINAAGQFRLVPVRGGTLPAGLTAQAVEAIIATTQPADSSHLSHLWSDRVGAAYARRMR